MGDALQHASGLRVCNSSLNICCTLIAGVCVGKLYRHFSYFFIFYVRFSLSRRYLFVIAHLPWYLYSSNIHVRWTKWIENRKSTLIWMQNRDICLLSTMHHLTNTDSNLRCSSLPIFPVLEMSQIFGSLTVMVERADIVMPDQSASERFHRDALVHSLEQKIPEHI